MEKNPRVRVVVVVVVGVVAAPERLSRSINIARTDDALYAAAVLCIWPWWRCTWKWRSVYIGA